MKPRVCLKASAEPPNNEKKWKLESLAPIFLSTLLSYNYRRSCAVKSLEYMYSEMKYQVFMLYTSYGSMYYSDIFYDDEGDSNRLEP